MGHLDFDTIDCFAFLTSYNIKEKILLKTGMKTNFGMTKSSIKHLFLRPFFTSDRVTEPSNNT